MEIKEIVNNLSYNIYIIFIYIIFIGIMKVDKARIFLA